MSILFKPKKRVHSANVQCEFYHRAKEVGLFPFAEYKHLNSRFDICIVVNGYIIAIVEIKNYTKPEKQNRNKKQLDKYCGYNTPVFLCRNFDDIEAIVQECLTLQEKYLAAIKSNSEIK